MLRPIGAGAAAYYWRGPDPGHWLGSGARALGLVGMPSPETLSRVLNGSHPQSGEHLGHAHPHRRAGWDLIFAAPKSVSLVAAVASVGDSRTMIMSHREAVAQTVAWLEGEVAWARRQRVRVAARGVAAAVFEHGNNATGEPHLHTHVLLANLVEGPDGRWSALDHGSLWLERRAIGAIYDLALRDQVGRHWPNLRWELSGDGSADLAGVPRQAIEAVSVRRRQVLRDLGGAAPAELTAPRIRERRVADPLGSPTPKPTPRRTRYAAARTRSEPASQDWRARLAETGFRPAHVTALLAPPPGPPPSRESGASRPPPWEAAEAWLTERGSSWSRSDAIRALAATAQRGASPASTMSLVSEWCRSSLASGAERWTTMAAHRLDRSVEEAAARLAARPLLAVPEAVLTEVLDRRPHLAPAARAAVRRLVGESGQVMVLPGVPGRDRLVEQAAILEAARASWESVGVHVALHAGATDVARWSALAGLRAPEPGVTPGVTVADRADRRTSAELLELLAQAARARAGVVLVEGGTLPARRRARSAALDGLKRLAGPAELGDPVLLAPREAERIARRPPPAIQSGQIVATATTGDAVGTILARWSIPAARRPVMVAFGPPEAEALNRLARNLLVTAGEVSTDQVMIGGRAFAPGDRVLVRRPGPAPSGTLGTVDSITVTPPTVTVRWDQRADQGRLDAWAAQRLVHGYATTVGLATRLSGSLLLLGDPGQAPGLAHRDVTGIVVAPTAGRRRDPFDRLAALAGVAAEGLRIRQGHVPPGEAGLPGEAGGSRAALAARRDRLEIELRGGLPPEVADERRRLGEDRAYAARHPGRAGSPDPQELERRAAEVARSEATLAGWLRANGERLVRWRELGRLLDEQDDLVACAAMLDPGSPAQLVAGPAPADPAMRPVWQRAVRATAIHAARWPEGERPSAPALRGPARMDLEAARSPAAHSPAALASRRRRDQAIQALAEARNRTLSGELAL